MADQKNELPEITQPSPAFWNGLMDRMDQGKKVTPDFIVDCYNQWATEGCYDESIVINGYGALDVLEETMNRLYPSNKSDVKILDVGACTGNSGQRLHDIGFKLIDALDPSCESLKVAEKRRVYITLYNIPMSEQPLDMPENSYDAMTVVGATGPKHLPLGAFTEMIRLVKPGGYIVNMTRAENLDRCQDYVDQWEPMIQGHMISGKWRLVEKELYANHYLNQAGYKHVFQVC